MLRQKIMVIWTKYHQIMKYIISGGTAAVVTIGSIYIFTDIFHIWYLVSGVFAFIAGFIVSFILQKFWTFADHSTDNVHIQAGMYLLVALINLAWNTFLLWLFVDIFHFWYILGQIFAGAIVALSSFFIYKRFIFKKTHHE